MRIRLVIVLGLATLATCGWDGKRSTEELPTPQVASRQARPPVDEPLGARYSLGMTLWHLGHDPEAIRSFHAFLAEKGVPANALLSEEELLPPADARRILIEPELLPEDQRGGWKAEGAYLTSTLYDAGPTVTFPLTVDRAGLYRLWVRYYGYTTGTGVTSLTVRRSGQATQPLVKDEIYDLATATQGPTWKSILVDLEAGAYSVSLGHVTRMWHALGMTAIAYARRMIDCLYLTDEIWSDAPSDEVLSEVKSSEAIGDIQWTTRPVVDPASWTAWRVRPISWEERAEHPRLFELSREFWRRRVDELALLEYPDDQVPDYRRPERQVIFDDGWNMVANPVRIRRQVGALRSDIDSSPKGHLWYWLYPGEFEKVESQWIRQGTSLFASYGATKGAAEQNLQVARDDTYHVWVRFRQINFHEIWKLEVSNPAGTTISFVRDQLQYPPDILPQSAWQKVGALEMAADTSMRFKFSLLPYLQPMTYRFVYDVFVTTDPEYQPKGTLRPPLSVEQYEAQAARLGAKPEDGYFVQVAPGVTSITQDWWPREKPSQAAELVMTRDMTRSVQLYLRSTVDRPITLEVLGDTLTRSDGTVFEGKIDWRAVGFVPWGLSRQQWSPWLLLHRPDITIPPYNVAQVWLTVDTNGLPAGEYEGRVELRSPGLPSQKVDLKIHVADFTIAPTEGILVNGYTKPPEGEEYLRAFSECGLNVWPSPMSKDEMRRWGIRLLELQVYSKDPEHYRARIAELKAMGLDYGDFVFKIRDEPVGVTADQLAPFIEAAQAVHAADPQARVSFNPAEAANLTTFQLLDPYCDFWVPYELHTRYPADFQKKVDIFSAKPWMWYTTPCYRDKVLGLATELFNQIRKVPTMPGLCRGTAFFALYYPFRDPWDAGYEHLRDVSVMILPSRHGPVATPAFEGIREGIQAANLATMVKERAAATDEEAQTLIKSGSPEELIRWLER